MKFPSKTEDPDFWYWEDGADKAVEWWNRNIVFSKDEWAGKPFILEPWQENDIIRPLIGWRRRDNGTRKYKTIWVEMARKNGKTEFAAGLNHLIMQMERTYGGEGYGFALDTDQARIVFDRMEEMTKLSAGLNDVCETVADCVYYKELNASFRILSGRPTGKHGKMPKLIYGDEPHEWTYATAKLLKTLRQGMAASSDRLEIYTTTAGDPLGPGWDMHNYALMVRDEIIPDSELLVVIYAIDPDDDWTDEKNWIKANPNLEKTVRLEFLRKEAEKAHYSETDVVDFKRYHCGIWTGEAARWLSVKAWKECTEYPDDPNYWRKMEDELAGRPCFGGLDLASTDDTTALIWLFPPAIEISHGRWKIIDAEQDDDGNWYIPDCDDDGISAKWQILCRIWIPKQGIQNRMEKGQIPYDKWATDGALRTTPGKITDYNAIKKCILGDENRDIAGDLKKFDVQMIGVDRHNSSQLVIDLENEGVPINWYPQSYAGMSPPSKQLNRRVNGRLLEHGNHPVLAWQAGNVIRKINEDEQIRPSKGQSVDKIDSVVSLIMAMGLAEGKQEEEDTIDTGFIELEDA